jgi:hypothetical protein
MPNNLTPKQAVFVAAYLESGNASAAYRTAYDAVRMKDTTIRVKAAELLRNGNITVRLAELRKAAEEKALVSLGDHMAELAAVRDQAKEAKQFSAAIKAEELRGRLSGLYADQPQQASPGRPEASQAVAHVLVQEDRLAPMFARFNKTIEHQPSKPGNGATNRRENED